MNNQPIGVMDSGLNWIIGCCWKLIQQQLP